MTRLVKWLLILAFVAAGLLTMSYAGARVAAGKVVGPHRALTGRTTTLAWRGVDSLRGRPRGWVFTYSQSRVPGLRTAQVVVSFKGQVLAMAPGNLDAIIEEWDRTRLP